MRLLVFFVATGLFKQCTGNSTTVTSKVEFGLYCPDKTDWEFVLSVSFAKNSPSAISGKATDHFEFRTMDHEASTFLGSVYYNVNHTCTTDGKWKGQFYNFRPHENKTAYGFLGFNLKSGLFDGYVFEKLFVNYLKKECPTGDCSHIRDRVAISCSQIDPTSFRKTCMNSFEKALKIVAESKSNTTTFIIIGSVVGVVLLIALVVTFLLCKRRKKKASNQMGSGMSGACTNSKTMTKSGTTQQGTTTGTIQKTGTVKTGNTGNTTTGGQRY